MSEAVRTMMRMDAEAAQEAAAQADAGFLWDFWYPAIPSTEIRGQKLVKAMLLEVPLVLGRTSEGKVFAMRDSCPHRGIPLSYGRLDGKVVECCYHGWRFDACSGQCVEIPSLSGQDKLKVERIFAGHFPCEERDGYVWVFMNVPGTRLPERIPAAPALTMFSDKYKITHLSCELPSHIDHGAEGSLPDRFRGGLEFVLSAGLDFPDLRQYFSAAGSGNDDPAGGRIETQPAFDVD